MVETRVWITGFQDSRIPDMWDAVTARLWTAFMMGVSGSEPGLRVAQGTTVLKAPVPPSPFPFPFFPIFISDEDIAPETTSTARLCRRAAANSSGGCRGSHV